MKKYDIFENKNRFHYLFSQRSTIETVFVLLLLFVVEYLTGFRKFYLVLRRNIH